MYCSIYSMKYYSTDKLIFQYIRQNIGIKTESGRLSCFKSTSRSFMKSLFLLLREINFQIAQLFFAQLLRHISINVHGSRDILMPKDILHELDIRTGFAQPGCKGMTEAMAAEVRQKHFRTLTFQELLVITIADNSFNCLIERSLPIHLTIAVQKDKVRIARMDSREDRSISKGSTSYPASFIIFAIVSAFFILLSPRSSCQSRLYEQSPYRSVLPRLRSLHLFSS